MVNHWSNKTKNEIERLYNSMYVWMWNPQDKRLNHLNMNGKDILIHILYYIQNIYVYFEQYTFIFVNI